MTTDDETGSAPDVAWPQVEDGSPRGPGCLMAVAVTLVTGWVAVWLGHVTRVSWLPGVIFLSVVVWGPMAWFDDVKYRVAKWGGVGLFIDDGGVTLGGRGGWSAWLGELTPPQCLRYHVPWGAVYDVAVIPGFPSEGYHADLGWRIKHQARSVDVLAERPPYFFGAGPLLVFRVDLRYAEIPVLPDNTVVSHVWAVPVHDVAAVERAFAARGVAVDVRPAGQACPWPTDLHALDEDFYRHWLARPVLVDERRPRVHRRFSGPPPRTLAEYEAACALEHDDPRRPTDEVGQWASKVLRRAAVAAGPAPTPAPVRRHGSPFRAWRRGRKRTS